MVTRLALLVSALLLLAGCGDDESPSANDPAATDESESPASAAPTKDPTADWPACDAVWKDGRGLKGSYQGCLEGATAVKSKWVPCEFGKKIVMYGDNFYAAPDFRRGSKLIIHRTQ